MAMTMMIPTVALTNPLFDDDKLLSSYELDCEPNNIFSSPDLDVYSTNNMLPPIYSDPFLQSDIKLVDIKSATTSNSKSRQLTDQDILVGRHKAAFNHIGNRRFRAIISSFLPQYFERKTRKDRSKLILEIVDTIQLAGVNFLKLTPEGRYEEITENEKRNKVGHSLRDAAGASRSNKSIAKKAKKTLTKKRSQKPLKVSLPNLKDDISSLLDDDSIGVDFPIDLDLLLSMP